MTMTRTEAATELAHVAGKAAAAQGFALDLAARAQEGGEINAADIHALGMYLRDASQAVERIVEAGETGAILSSVFGS